MKNQLPKLCLLIFFLSLIACNKNWIGSKKHPLESGLIPNIQIATSPQTYSIEERLTEHNISGLSLGVLEDHKLAFAKGYGWARKEQNIAVEPNTIFAAGSISKSITGLAALILEEQGKISLDKDISEYLKTWQLPERKYTQSKKITLRHLLNHRAGINPFNSKGLKQSQDMPSLTAILSGNDYSPGVKIDTIPGVVYKYSNLGFEIVQLVLEEVTGKQFEEIAQELVLGPLQMSKSTFAHIEPTTANTAYAYAYDSDNKQYEGFWRKSLILASGGLKSSVKDLARLLNALSRTLEGQQVGLITPAIAKQISTQEGYSLGFEIQGEKENFSITHTGRVPGFFAYMRIYPNTGKGIIMLCNSDNGGEIFKDLLRGASAIYPWDIIKPKVINVIPLTAEELKPYIGNYRLVLGGDEYIAQILPDGRNLKYSMKGDKEEYPIRPVAPNQFIDLIDGDLFEFVIKDGISVQVTTNNEYTFDRISE